ncbi:MAG: hypothetical protein LBL13_04230 [Bacteroidales bacterium]|jgi:hypothetical protein|nr:hypothetical protein [Bacteroidales bacterium]
MRTIIEILFAKAQGVFQRGTIAILCIILIAFFITTGCDESTPLIPTQSDSTALQPTEETTNLLGTKWHLRKFVQVSQGITKTPEPESDQCYWIFFDSDTTLFGKTSTNDIVGHYRIDPTTSTICMDEFGGTKISELFDGNLYMKKMLSICSFELMETSLKLYYNETDYLLFNAYSYENK